MVPRKKPEQKPEQTEAEILKLLTQTKEEIQRRLAPFGEKVPVRNSASYPDTLNAYIDEVEKTRSDVAPILDDIAEKISSLGGKGWQEDNRILQFWMGFTHVVQTLRHNTAKGPAVVYVSKDNKLIGYSAANFLLAEMEASPKIRRKLLEADSRKDFNICAEPAAAAKAIGHKKLGTNSLLLSGGKWKKKHIKRSEDDKPRSNSDYIALGRIPERRLEFLRRITKVGKREGQFKNSVLVTTTDPCGSCTRVLINIGVTEVISDAQSYFMPMGDKRRDEMLESAERLDKNGVTHRRVHYQLNI